MKFAVSLVAESSARLGSLTEFARIPEAVFETPLLLLHTRGASVPHLSYDLLQMVSTGHHMLQMPLVTLVDHTKNVKAFGKGIAEFAGLKEYLNYVSVQDSGTTTPEGYHEKNSISLWTRGGRKLIDPQTYISCIEALKPDMFQAIVDGDTTQSSSAKRVRKSVDVTVKFAGICADLKEKSDVLKDTPMLACITGGYNIKERLRCINELKGFGAAGYVIEGFHTNGESATNLLWEDVEPVLTETLGSLPENLPRAFHGPITPIVLLKLVSKGIDIFDATFPWLVAERGGALVFPNSLSKENAPVTETLPSVKAPAVVATDQKVAKLADDNSNDESVDRVYEINLKDKIYFSDTRPLLEGCSCYSCRKYSRSYVHHLTATGELQGPILIMMHNLHHYINFFKSIQQAIKDNELQALQSKLDLFVSSRRN
ncbi:queuine tRNA-ribosyltransferase accessory subunit 2-like [Daphnia pulex]|uniref:Queuine tRNA-ribosyltransferase accessory subunit 2 n=1 Tax=Daphnia pulex TaxID=6669 RepID=A0A4Y7MRG2_DAPPU|nr:queuine tRNA-ribosyltransferase accessory subunit 2-like [Daphnia pulex]SVE84337.1 EOG090X08JG [Daphnia pulex]